MNNKKKRIIGCFIVCMIGLGILKYTSGSYFSVEKLRDKVIHRMTEREIVEITQYRTGTLAEYVYRTTNGMGYIKARKQHGIVWQHEIANYYDVSMEDEPVVYGEHFNGETAIIYGICKDENIKKIVFSDTHGYTKELLVGPAGLFSIRRELGQDTDMTLTGFDKEGKNLWKGTLSYQKG
ncbi:MAG: hypothetical protein Q4F05_16385 [bacterium]|nr:hypothetical protein [bacterium]